MAEAPSQAAKNLTSLKVTVETVCSLLTQLLAAIKTTDSPFPSTSVPNDAKAPKNEVNALCLAHDAAALIKAHSTKLSLLLINSPFTPTAIMTVLREVSSGPLPALATAVELCHVSLYTKTMRSELQWRAEKVFVEFRDLVRAVPLDGNVLNGESKNSRTEGSSSSSKGSLAATGVVWQACDRVMDLKSRGITGLIIQKAEQYRDTLKDALEELREWGEEGSDDDDHDDGAGREDDINGDETANPAQDAIDNMFDSQRHIPIHDTYKIRERLDCSLQRLKLVLLLYQAIIKRRFKTLPALPPFPSPSLPTNRATPNSDADIIHRLDTVLSLLKQLPDAADELANAFYELDNTAISKRMEECFLTAASVAELLVMNWEDKEDEFSAWAGKFQGTMKKGW